MDNTLQLARLVADICYDNKADDIIVMDLQGLSVMCDYFVIASAPTRNQIGAMTADVDKRLSAQGIEPKSVQGRHDKGWVLMDYGSVVVHLFLTQEREFYNLEGLWHEAPIVYVPEGGHETEK